MRDELIFLKIISCFFRVLFLQNKCVTEANMMQTGCMAAQPSKKLFMSFETLFPIFYTLTREIMRMTRMDDKMTWYNDQEK